MTGLARARGREREHSFFSASARALPHPFFFRVSLSTPPRCAACAAARTALATAAAALGDLATPLSLDLTVSGAAAAAVKAGLPKADAASPGLVAWVGGAPPSVPLAPGSATPPSIAALALDHARAVAAGRLGVGSLGDAKEEGSGGGEHASAGGGCGCGCGKKAKTGAAGEKKKTASSSSSSSSGHPSDLPRASAFFGRGTHVRALTGTSLRTLTRSGTPALVMFYAGWCGHCQAAKPEVAAAADALARAGSPAIVAALDCEADRAACEGAGVRGFPTFKWFDEAGRGEAYTGPRDASAFEAFVAGRAKPPPPEVGQLLSGEGFARTCLGPATRLCLLAFLPPLADTTAADRRAALALLAEAAAPYAGRPYGWAWTAGGDHPGLEAAVGVGGYGWPAFVAVVPPPADGSGGAKVAHLKGAFDAEGVRSFIEAARTGRVGAAGVAGDLVADGRVDAWDGSDDAPGEGGGDEFSLADLGLA